MKQILLFLFIVLFAQGQSRLKEQIDLQDGILQLDKNNYDHAIKTYPRLIILFKTYGCNLCLEYRSKFIELAQVLSEYEIYLGEVIAAENKALSIKMECKSYPTVFYYKDGVKDVFPNEDEAVQLLFEYALQQAYGQVTDLKSLSELQLFKKRSNIVVLSYQQDDLSQIASKNTGIKFGNVIDSSLISTARYVIINKAFQSEILFNGALNKLNDFINQNAYPLVFSFTEEEFKKAERDQIPLVGVIIDKKETNPVFINNFKELANDFLGQLRFVLIDWNDELTMKRFKYFVGQFLDFNRIYYYNFYKQYTRNQACDNKSITLQKLKKIITDVQSYQEAYWEGDGDVHELTPLNFNSQINENPNHVVVFSYIPGCDICFGFNEIFTELVNKFENYPHIVFAKHNYRDNKIKEIFIERIPTLYIYQKINGQVNPIRYEGEQTVLSIAQSIENLLITEPKKMEIPIQEKHIDSPIQDQQSENFNKGKIIQLTTDTFESVVLTSKNHVFVKFYAPWCGHCQQMAQEYELLAQVYKGNNNIVIAEIDWTIHQIQSIKINGFPTLILFYKENGQYEQIQYKGQRTAQKMKQFIDDQMSDINDEL